MNNNGHDKTNYKQALEKAEEWGNKIPIGIFYNVKKPIFE